MSAKGTLARSIARRLIAHAEAVLPRSEQDWARAMRSELEYIQEDVDAVKWAFGCVSACYIQRLRNMEVGNMNAVSASRIVLTLEMLLCFWGPTGFLLASSSAVVGMHSFLGGSTFAALCVTTSLVGPIGLYFAFRSVVLERRDLGHLGTVVLGVLAAWAFVGNLYTISVLASPGYEWRGYLFMSVLPALGAAHLIYLARAGRRQIAMA